MAYIVGGNTIYSTSTDLPAFCGLEVENTMIFTPVNLLGTNKGYALAGLRSSPQGINNEQAFNWPFASDTNASGPAILNARDHVAGASSEVHGYSMGGNGPFLSPPINRTNAQKFPFATQSPVSSIGGLSAQNNIHAGVSSAEDGFRVVGMLTSGIGLEKFSFSSNAAATDISTFGPGSGQGAAGASAPFAGYVGGGAGSVNDAPPSPQAPVTNIFKFPFATSSYGSRNDVGDLTQARQGTAGTASQNHGYFSGGIPQGVPQFSALSRMDKFPFASEGPSTNIGSLSVSRYAGAGSASQTHGYTAGGCTSSGPGQGSNIIDKFPFATDTNASDVGDLTQNTMRAGGAQD